MSSGVKTVQRQESGDRPRAETQTKRWLKNEYGVALRAGLEEELEQVCASATMVLSH